MGSVRIYDITSYCICKRKLPSLTYTLIVMIEYIDQCDKKR